MLGNAKSKNDLYLLDTKELRKIQAYQIKRNLVKGVEEDNWIMCMRD